MLVTFVLATRMQVKYLRVHVSRSVNCSYVDVCVQYVCLSVFNTLYSISKHTCRNTKTYIRNNVTVTISGSRFWGLGATWKHCKVPTRAGGLPHTHALPRTVTVQADTRHKSTQHRQKRRNPPTSTDSFTFVSMDHVPSAPCRHVAEFLQWCARKCAPRFWHHTNPS